MAIELKAGSTFPDYELPDETGKRHKLSDLQGRDPLFLVLARGHYCPKEGRQATWMVEMEPEFDVAYTAVVTISSTDSPLQLMEWKASLGAHWTFLSDRRRTIQRDLGLTEYTDPNHDPIIPHSLFLEPGLVIHSVYNGYWYWGRPSPEDAWRELRQIQAKMRPDWDLSKPGLREQWEAGERGIFYPYKERKKAT